MIKNLNLIKESIKKTKKIDGCLTDISMNVMYSLISNIKDKNDFLEIGVFKGKSANVISTFLEENTLHLIDINYIDPRTIQNLNNKNKIKSTIENICMLNPANYPYIYNNKFSIIHEDTLHTARTTTAGLNLAANVLSDNGIYIIDDFSFCDFVVIKTVLNWLDKNPNQLVPFLTDGWKVYLTRPDAYSFWYNYALKNLQDDIYNIAGMNTRLFNRRPIVENTILSIDNWTNINKKCGNYMTGNINCCDEIEGEFI